MQDSDRDRKETCDFCFDDQSLEKIRTGEVSVWYIYKQI